jgi:ribosome-associated translation inhibitor RaiA
MLPTLISYHGLEASEALTELVRARAQQIAQRDARILSLRVAIEAPHHHRRHGNQYRVRLELKLPGHELVVANDAPTHAGEDDAHHAVRHAFDVLLRQLTSTQARRSGKQRAQDAARASVRG